MSARSIRTIPTSAAWLGGTGAIPFIMLAVAVLIVDDARVRPLLTNAVITYGAVILSFLGGVRWGIAIAADDGAENDKLPLWLTISIIPSLLGWGALFMPEHIGAIFLAVCFVSFGYLDIREIGISSAPAWYSKLRLPLSLAASASLMVVALG